MNDMKQLLTETLILLKYSRLEKIRAERENELFPDEMDTPMDQTARVRFQK